MCVATKHRGNVVALDMDLFYFLFSGDDDNQFCSIKSLDDMSNEVFILKTPFAFPK